MAPSAANDIRPIDRNFDRNLGDCDTYHEDRFTDRQRDTFWLIGLLCMASTDMKLAHSLSIIVKHRQ
jgi:hypothetical protein